MLHIDEKPYSEARAKLEALFDAGTLVELGAYTRRKGGQEFEGVLCGYGAVEGKLTFAFVQDSGRSKGAFGKLHSEKITRLYELAVKNGAPVIGVFDSAGAVVYDGAEAMAAYGRLMKCVSDASGIIPQIAISDGVCGGASAVVLGMFDFAVAVKGKSKLYVNSPFIIGKDAGTAEFTSENGLCAYSADSESDAFAYARKLVSMLPSNNAEGGFVENGDDMNRAVEFDGEGYSIRELIKNVADDGQFTEIYSGYTKNSVLGFASFGGILSGVVACDPENGGILDIRTARAASKLVGFCDSFSIPVLTLVDSIGLDVSMEAENAAYASELARLAYAYTSSENAKLTVVLGKAYGTAFTLLGSRAVGADMALALPSAKISVLSPEASVAFLWNGKVGEDGKTREELEAEWTEKYASAEDACAKGEIDDIIEPQALRARICAGFSMLASKAEEKPMRRHANMPL